LIGFARDDTVGASMNLPGLIEWLMTAFKADELLRFVELSPAGRQITANLESRSLAAIAHESVMGWERHGVLGPEIRELLLQGRPARAEEVKTLFLKTLTSYVRKKDSHL
jgi:hypothetical protein